MTKFQMLIELENKIELEKEILLQEREELIKKTHEFLELYEKECEENFHNKILLLKQDLKEKIKELEFKYLKESSININEKVENNIIKNIVSELIL